MEDFDIDLSDVGGTNINNLDSYARGRNKQPEAINFKDIDNKSKNNVNINNLIRDLESDLKNHSNINVVPDIPDKPVKIVKPVEKTAKNDTIEILIYVLVFMILNNRFIIDIIFKYVPFIKTINNPYPNLIVRAIMFYLIVYAYKKYYAHN
jgi:hypothetical protein